MGELIQQAQLNLQCPHPRQNQDQLVMALRPFTVILMADTTSAQLEIKQQSLS
jgi:hypothetical protein